MKCMMYGAGRRGKQLLEMWKGKKGAEIVGFYDRAKTGTLDGLPIMKYEDGKRYVPVVISFVDQALAMEVRQDLFRAGYQKIYWYLGNPYEDSFEGQLDFLGGVGHPVLKQVEMHVSDACNLNCRGCTHFSPLFHHIDADLASCLEDVKKLAGKFSFIREFYLLGGEPFLNPEISAYVEGIRKILPRTRLTIVTNGLLIPRLPDEVLACIRREKVFVSISEYEPTHEIIDEIKAVLERAGVQYSLRPFDIKQMFNKPIEIEPSGKYPLKCISDGCVNIYKGKICRCPTLMYVPKFNEVFGTHLPTEGIMDLDSAPEGDALLEKLEKPVPLCKHCVENLMPWGRCERKPSIGDFAAVK